MHDFSYSSRAHTNKKIKISGKALALWVKSVYHGRMNRKMVANEWKAARRIQLKREMRITDGIIFLLAIL